MSFDIPHLTGITLDDLEAPGTSADILGTGGGGNPRLSHLRFQTFLGGDAYPDSVELVDPRDLPPDAAVASVDGIGAPTISVEKLASGDEEVQSLRAIGELSGRTVDALIPGEIGGTNSVAPLCVTAMTDLPVVNADGMGRAFPELQIGTFLIYGTSVSYAVTTDERDNQVVYRDIDSIKRLGDLARVITVRMGDCSGYAFSLMTGTFVSEYAVPHAVSLATELGWAVERARDAGTDPIGVGRKLLDDEELFAGKIVDMRHHNCNDFALGSVTFAGLGEDATLEIEFQNKFLVAWDDGGGLRTTVSDLICLVDTDTGAPVATDALRYGQRVCILGVSVPELLTTPEALDVIGPEVFGHEVPYDLLPRNETGWWPDGDASVVPVASPLNHLRRRVSRGVP